MTGDRVVCFFDGACPGNQFDQKGPMRAAFTVGQKSFVRNVQELGTSTGPVRSNNVAEYQGLIMLLEYLLQLEKERGSPGKYLIYGDSELVIKQMLGLYRVKRSHLAPLHVKARQLTDALDVDFGHVRRDSNRAGLLLE